MHKAFTFAVLAVFLSRSSGTVAQVVREGTFVCGRITPSPSDKAKTYYDLEHGFRFEFPSGWVGHEGRLSDPGDNACPPRFSCPSQILVNPLLATSDPRFYVSEGAIATGTEAINGLEWTALAWPDGGHGYYAYRDGLAIEFEAFPVGKSRKPSPVALVALSQILSSFSFLGDSSRLDRQLARLSVGQKLGDLTVERVVPGTSGFDGTVGKIEFAGQLKLTGAVELETTMGGGSSRYYFVESARGGRTAIPPFRWCPLDTESFPPARVTFSNQGFAERQFGRHDWYDAEATIVIDRVSEALYNAGEGGSVSARLVAVVGKSLAQ